MYSRTLKLILLLAPSYVLFRITLQQQVVQMYHEEDMFHHAYFIQHPFSVLSVSGKILSSFEGTSLQCALNCLKTTSCFSFNFGIHSSICQILATDKYISSEKFGPSHQFDHHSIPVSNFHFNHWLCCALDGLCKNAFSQINFVSFLRINSRV